MTRRAEASRTRSIDTPSPPHYSYCLERIGADQFLFASDYPHWDMNFPHAVSGLLDRQDLSAEQKRKLTYDNLFRFYTNLRIDEATPRATPGPTNVAQG